MAKKSLNKSGRQGSIRRNPDLAKTIALLVFIVVGLAILTGTLWYYLYYQPRAVAGIQETAGKFTLEYFNVEHTSISGQEGMSWMTEKLARAADESGRAASWKEREIVSTVDGDVEVRILHQGLGTGLARVIFWQYEEADGKEGKNYLQYYDYQMIYVSGDWLINQITVPSESALQEFRKTRGVWDQHYADEDEADPGEDEDDDEDTE